MKESKPPGRMQEHISEGEIRAQLGEIFKSRDFVASRRMMDFLEYIVEQALIGKGGQIKAYNIAVDVFGAGADFDAQLNPLVRTEAVRLRSKLEHYYLLNPAAPVHITIPKGGYAPVFSRLEPMGAETPPVLLPCESNLPSLPSTILVQPFETISNSSQGRCFNAGLVNEITNLLTRFNELTVVEHSDALPEKVLAVPARFVLKGSLQAQRERFKLWVTLSDCKYGSKIWAETFCGNFQQDLFELQANIAEKIVYLIAADFGVLQQAMLKEIEAGCPAPSMQKAGWLYYRWGERLSPLDFRLALAALDEAICEDADNAQAQAMLSDLYAADYQLCYGMVQNGLEQSLPLAVAAVNAAPECQTAHLALAYNYFLRGDCAKFRLSAERALEINPFSSSAITTLASWYGLLGFWDEALALLGKVFQLNPASPGWCHAMLAFHHYLRGDYDNALLEAHKINMPHMLWDPLFRLIAAVRQGEEPAASIAVSNLLELHPDFAHTGKKLIACSIPNQGYVEQIIDDLDACF